MKKYNLTLLGVLIFSLSFSQDVLETDTYKMNNIFDKKQHMERDVVPLSHLREADVMWSRKIWREIDLRQPINFPLYYPQERAKKQTVDRDNLFTVLYKAATNEGENINIRAFSANWDDEFQDELTIEELKEQIEGVEKEIFYKNQHGEDSLDVNGERVFMSLQRENAQNRSLIKKWRIKEQWFFDKQRSVIDVRIIGLCPIADDVDEDGVLTGAPKAICWFYFPECRHELKNSQAFNLVKNEGENKTFEDIFMKRMFSSTIIKEGNVYDRNINHYMVGLDALLEAQNIKNEIFNFEHDLWEY
jgi:gliding motility associated protien GldN